MSAFSRFSWTGLTVAHKVQTATASTCFSFSCRNAVRAAFSSSGISTVPLASIRSCISTMSSRGTSGAKRLWLKKSVTSDSLRPEVCRRMRPISKVSAKPAVVTMPVLAARPVSSAFKPTVVPWPNFSMPEQNASSDSL